MTFITVDTCNGCVHAHWHLLTRKTLWQHSHTFMLGNSLMKWGMWGTRDVRDVVGEPPLESKQEWRTLPCDDSCSRLPRQPKRTDAS